MRCESLYGGLKDLGKALVLVLMSVLPLKADPASVVAFGDSLTQGYGLAVDDGFVPQLQRWLNREGVEVTLINAGVSGDTTTGGAARVDWTLGPNVDAMIISLGGNDMLRGTDPKVSRENLSNILKVAQDREIDVLLIGMKAAGNYGPDYKAQFDSMYPELAQQYGVQFSENFFSGLASTDLASVSNYMQQDGIHPNAGGVALIVEALGPDVARLIDGLNK